MFYTITIITMPARKYRFKVWDKFGRLTIINDVPIKTKWGNKRECQCNCWTIKRVFWQNLYNWSTKSCWCYQKDMLSVHPRGLKNWIWQNGPRFPGIYRKMKYRCENPKCDVYELYWWRWIKCEWNSLEDFYNDMYPSYKKHCEQYGEKNTTIDRINVNWNYSKENCRWATMKEQWYNKRNNVTIEIDGETLWVYEFAKRYNITEDAARERIMRYKKWEKTFEALTYYGSKKNNWMEIKWEFYTYDELREMLGADSNWLWRRIIKYNNWEITGDEMLLTKEEVKDPLKRKRAITINWKVYDSNSLAEEVWVDKQTALRRIKLYKEWEMPEDIVLYKGPLPTRWKIYFNKENNKWPEKE